MKKDIHPKCQDVIFKDISSDEMFLVPSTVKTEKKISHEGKEYPLVEVEITSSSHPFYTGTQKLVDSAGRIDRFRKRFKLDS